MKKRTRLKISIIALIYFGLTAWLGLFRNMETLAITCAGAITPILTMYIWSEGKRPSDPNDKTFKTNDIDGQ